VYYAYLFKHTDSFAKFTNAFESAKTSRIDFYKDIRLSHPNSWQVIDTGYWEGGAEKVDIFLLCNPTIASCDFAVR
jgi:hypothetical protein